MDKKGVSRISSKPSCLTVPKKTLCVAKNFLLSQNFLDKREEEEGSIKIFSRKSVVSQCQKTLWGSLRCFKENQESKIFIDGRVITIFRRKLFDSRYRQIFCVSENFWYQKNSWIKGGEGVARFFVKKLLSHRTGKPSVLQKRISIEKFHGSEGREGGGGSITIHCREFVSQYRKTFDVSEILGYRKILCLRVVCQGFLSNVCVSQYQKRSQGNPSVFRKTSGVKKLMDKSWEMEGLKGFPVKNCLLTVPKIFVGEFNF